jgi:transposase-like protein
MSTEYPNGYQPVVKKYNESFKMSVVGEVITRQISQQGALKKYDIGSWHTLKKWIIKYGSNKEVKKMRKVRMPNDKLRLQELKSRIRELEKLVTDLQLEKRVLDKVIELAEKEYGIKIKKNSGAQQSRNSSQKDQQ